MSKNLEILNYLNLISPKLGNLFKTKGYNPLPSDFVFTEEKIKERLEMSQIEEFVKLPDFIFDDKKIIKKKLKNSIKNIKNIKKNQKFNQFSIVFSQKFDFYIEVRLRLSQAILKDFKNFDFSENSAFQEIIKIDPVMFEKLEDLFNESFDLSKLPSDFEEKYTLSYIEKLKLIEKKKQKEQKTVATRLATKTKPAEKTKATVAKPRRKIQMASAQKEKE
ncbi:MAG: hypothetical protein E7375_00290 [Clostridiales bacterium]|nr:hypothetical protein [Clostridiales bacterium]